MRPAVPQETIDVRQLRIGMHVHLDGGWLSHPFPLSSFRIDSEAQIDTIRALGRPRVRWSPALSVAADTGAAGLDAARSPDVGASHAIGPDAAPTRPGEDAAGDAPARIDPSARREHRRRLAADREALAVAERQYGEVGRDWSRMAGLVAAHPEQARGQAEGLARAVLDKMLVAGDVCIRLLGETSGDRAAMHAVNVGIVSLLLGRALGWPEDELMDLGVGSMLHDIGKDDLPERVRQRAEHFSSAELQAYEEHVARGVVHAKRMRLSAGATLVIAQHHEHSDGSGFPQRIGAERMTPSARVVALVNRYDRMVNPALGGSRAHTPHEALSLLFAQRSGRFDHTILGAFIRMMGVYPPGSTVQLTDDRYAMVVAVNGSRPLKPRVLVHDAAAGPGETLLVDLEAESDLSIRRSLSPQNLPAEALYALAPRQRVAYFFEPVLEPETVG